MSRIAVKQQSSRLNSDNEAELEFGKQRQGSQRPARVRLLSSRHRSDCNEVGATSPESAVKQSSTEVWQTNEWHGEACSGCGQQLSRELV
jgi:hypothetical protein